MSKPNSTAPILEECYVMLRELRKNIDRLDLLLRQVASDSQERCSEDISENPSEQPVRAWKPPVDDALFGGLDAPMPRILPVHSRKQNGHDAVSRLRQSHLGRFYRTNLKRFSLTRRVVSWLWRNGYPVYVNRVSSLWAAEGGRRWLQLMKLSHYVTRTGVESVELTRFCVVEPLTPRVFPARDQACFASRDARYIFPGVFVTTVPNAMLYGGTNLIIAGDKVLCHDLYDFERDYTSEELHGRTRIDPESDRVRWFMHDAEPAPLAEAATFIDACASNYAHWLTEVLPRICLFCSEERFRDVSLIVNDYLHTNIMESLFYIAGSQREIITVPAGRALSVTRLHAISPTGYVPFDRRTDKLTGHSDGVFSRDALRALQERIAEAIPDCRGQDWPEKLYLRRNSGARRLINGDEIERILVSRGYAIVETETLTFVQQVLLFQNARSVIAPTGSACANVIFCKPDTRVTIMMGKHERMPYRYWLNMAGPLGISVDYVLGEIVDTAGLGIHGDFKVNPNDVLDAAAMMERP